VQAAVLETLAAGSEAISMESLRTAIRREFQKENRIVEV